MALTTWGESLRDPRATFRWLLRLKFPGGEWLWSDVGANIYMGKSASSPLRHWRPGLEVVQRPRVTVDPYSGRSSVPRATVRVRNAPEDPADPSAQLRFQDLPAKYRFFWEEARAWLYVWAENTPFSEAKCRLYGTVAEPAVEQSSVATFELTGILARYNRGLPRHIVDRDTFPSRYADDAGMGYPVRFGNFTRAECPLVHTGDYKALASEGEIASISGGWFADTAKTASLVRTTDAEGNIVSLADFADDPKDNLVTVSGVGIRDNAHGFFTGTKNATLWHPAAQLHYLLFRVLDVPLDHIDHGSFRGAAEFLAGWSFDTSVEGETDLFGVAEDVCAWMRGSLHQEGDRIRLGLMNLGAAAKMHIGPAQIASFQRLKGGKVVGSRPMEGGAEYTGVVNDLLLRYRWTYKAKKRDWAYTRAYRLRPAAFDYFARSKQKYEVRKGVLYSRHISDDKTAQLAATRTGRLLWKPRETLSLLGRAETHNLRPWDKVLVTVPEGGSSTGEGYERKPFIVIEVEHDAQFNDLVLLEA